MSCLHCRTLLAKLQQDWPWTSFAEFMIDGSCSYSYRRTSLRTVMKQLLIPHSNKDWKGFTMVRVSLAKHIAAS